MILYIIRHAWAGHYGDPKWPDDRQRPLTDEGRKRFARMVRTLAPRGFAPETIATSPLVRCRQTAEIVAEEVAWVGHAPDVGHLTAALIGEGRSGVRFAKGAIAAIQFQARPAPGEGELRWLVTAKTLGC